MSYLNELHNLDTNGNPNTPTFDAQTIRNGLDVLVGLDRPRIVCLCGSTRFKSAFEDASRRESLAGRIVLSVGLFGWNNPEGLSPEDALGADIKTGLDWLHKRKIDLADEVLVLNVDGYVGESTRSEIAYAEKFSKPVRYLEPVAVTA